MSGCLRYAHKGERSVCEREVRGHEWTWKNECCRRQWCESDGAEVLEEEALLWGPASVNSDKRHDSKSGDRAPVWNRDKRQPPSAKIATVIAKPRISDEDIQDRDIGPPPPPGRPLLCHVFHFHFHFFLQVILSDLLLAQTFSLFHMCLYLDSNIVVKFIFSSYFGKKHDPLRTASAHVGRYHFIKCFATCQSNVPDVLVTTTSRRSKNVKAIDKHRCIFGVVHLINSA